MKHRSLRFLACLLLGILITGSLCIGAAASEDDNSLYSLGLMTDGAVSEQEVEYGVYEFDVIVPAGTTELELDPIPSNENARISSVEGTELDVDGNGTVLITVEAPNGDPFTYTVHVTSMEEEPQTQKQTEAPTEPQTEKKEKETEPQPQTETEEKLYVEVPRDTVTQAQNTITDLQNEIIEYRENVNLYQKIMYVLLAVSIIFLFIIINLLLRSRDLKAELKEYRSLGYAPSGKNKDKDDQGGRGQGAPEAPDQKERKKEKHSVYYEKAPLDVAPQTSSRSKRLPEYEAGQNQPFPAAAAQQNPQPETAAQQNPQPAAAAQQNPQPAPAAQQNPQPAPEAPQNAQPAPGAQQGQAPSGKTREVAAPKKDNSGVQVDMIDL